PSPSILTRPESTREPGPASRRPEEAVRWLEAVTDTALGRLSLEELLSELLVRVRSILGVDTAAILLREGEELVARVAKGLEEEVEAGVRIPIGRGFAGLVASEKRPIFIEDVDHSQVLNPILREKGVRSLPTRSSAVRGCRPGWSTTSSTSRASSAGSCASTSARRSSPG